MPREKKYKLYIKPLNENISLLKISRYIYRRNLLKSEWVEKCEVDSIEEGMRVGRIFYNAIDHKTICKQCGQKEGKLAKIRIIEPSKNHPETGVFRFIRKIYICEDCAKLCESVEWI